MKIQGTTVKALQLSFRMLIIESNRYANEYNISILILGTPILKWEIPR